MTDLVSLRETGLAFDPTSQEFRDTASYMAKEYREGVEEILRAVNILKEQSERMFQAFEGELKEESSYVYNPFSLDVSHDRQSCYRYDMTKTVEQFKRGAWRLLVNKLGIKNLMSIQNRAEYEKTLESGELPEIHEDNIISLILSLGDQLPNFATEAAKEVFEMLRPSRGWGAKYKTNNAFKVGRRVILTWMIEKNYGGGFRVNYRKDQHIRALESVFMLLDGKGPIKDRRPALEEAINASGAGGKGETTYFRFKCYKNTNLHLEFKRLDLVKQLNGLATGSFELGRDEDQVA